MKVFLCFRFADETFAASLAYALRKQNLAAVSADGGSGGELIECFFYPDSRRGDRLANEIDPAIRSSDVFVFVAGEKLGEYQIAEAKLFEDTHPRANAKGRSPGKERGFFVVAFDEHLPSLPTDPPVLLQTARIVVSDSAARGAEEAARQIILAAHNAGLFERTWVPLDGIPLGYPFTDEKAISDAFRRGEGRLDAKYVELGCVDQLPEVIRVHRGSKATRDYLDNPLDPQAVGLFRNQESKVIVDARIPKAGEPPLPFHFLEAGPRNRVRYPLHGTTDLKVAILVSGGIAPGINAVIDGIVSRHRLYSDSYARTKKEPTGGTPYRLSIIGYQGGFNGLLRSGNNWIHLCMGGRPIDTRKTANDGGSILSTGRADDLLAADPAARHQKLERIVDRLHDDGISILYVIGGDGSMRAAHALHHVAMQRDRDISVIAVPKTMDNDILWVWQSFGFLSAAEYAKRTVQQLNTEVTSNPRLGIVQLFGSDSGFVVSHAAIGSGVSLLALIPEVEFSMDEVWNYVKERLLERYDAQHGKVPHGLILMAETAIPRDAEKYIHDPSIGLTDAEREAILAFRTNGSVVQGQTPDALRTGGLRIVTQVLLQKIRDLGQNESYFADYRVFNNEPRHMIRAMPPSVSDVIFGHRLGTLAVDNAMAGYRDFMISCWLTEFVLVPLPLVVLGRKRVRKDGIFWKTVLASTGQPPKLFADEPMATPAPGRAPPRRKPRGRQGDRNAQASE